MAAALRADQIACGGEVGGGEAWVAGERGGIDLMALLKIFFPDPFVGAEYASYVSHRHTPAGPCSSQLNSHKRRLKNLEFFFP